MTTEICSVFEIYLHVMYIRVQLSYQRFAILNQWPCPLPVPAAMAIIPVPSVVSVVPVTMSVPVPVSISVVIFATVMVVMVVSPSVISIITLERTCKTRLYM